MTRGPEEKIWLCKISDSNPLAVSSFESFKRICEAKYTKENKKVSPKSHGHLPHTIGCRGCEVGAAIISGELQTLPMNIPLLAAA